MIKAEIFRNKDFVIYGFRVTGHAGYEEDGEDIVCSAVSILVINTINCIEKFTKEKFSCDSDEENVGYIAFYLTDIEHGAKNHDVELLLESMLYGLNNIEKGYGKYIKVFDKGGGVVC